MPGKALKPKQAGEPLERSRETGGLIDGNVPIRKPEFKRNRLVCLGGRAIADCMEQTPCFPITSEYNWCGIGQVSPVSVLPFGKVKQNNLMALFPQEMANCQSGQAGAQNKHGV